MHFGCHWHTPSEHTYNGKHNDLEFHFAFGDPDTGEFMVYMIMFDSDNGNAEDNPFITTVLDADKTKDFEGDERIPADYSLLAEQLKYASDSFVAMNGSHTEPPCADNIIKIIPDLVLPISKEQLEAFQELSPENAYSPTGYGNNRATQPRDLEAFPVFRNTMDGEWNGDHGNSTHWEDMDGNFNGTDNGNSTMGDHQEIIQNYVKNYLYSFD